jgi:hypothetical protein
VAHASNPHIHNLRPDDIEISRIADQQLAVVIYGADGAFVAGDLFIDGDSDRERLANLTEIGNRIRRAALEMTASLVDGEPVLHSTGAAPNLPDAAPLHGTQVFGRGLGNPDNARVAS